MKTGRSLDIIKKALASTSKQMSITTSIETSKSMQHVHENSSSSADDDYASHPENEGNIKNLYLADIVDPTCDSIIGTTQITQTDSKRSISNSSCSNDSTSSNDFDSDDSVFDKNYVPPQKKNLQKANIYESDSDYDFIENSQTNNIRISETPERDDSGPQNQFADQMNQLTKKGAVRKRKYYDTKHKERRRIKKELKNNTKYCLKPGCIESCKKKCNTKITLDHRAMLNKTFHKFSNKEQYIYIANSTSQSKPARRTQSKNPNSKKIYRGKTI